MKFYLLIIILYLISFKSYSQTPADTFSIESKYVKEGKYIAEVTLPPNYQPHNDYPICYFLDLKLAEPLMKDVSDSLLRNKLVSDYIFVGIKCNDTSRWCGPQRFRDFSPCYNKEFECHINKDTSNHISGGGPNFLSFLKHELIPLVEGKYKSISSERALFGVSFSGLFAAYTLLEDTKLFSKYIIGTPSLWYNNFEMVNRLKNTNANKLRHITNVYMCVGGKEDPVIITGYKNFSQLLSEKKINVTAEVYSDKDHLGVWKDLLVKGIMNSFPLSQ